MKKLYVTVLIIFSWPIMYAQDSVKIFSTYKFTVPGSQLQSKMVPVDAGSFVMGSSSNESNRDQDEGPQRRLSIAAFWMGVFEVTRDEFDVFCKDETTSANTDVDAVTRPSPQYIDLSFGMGKEGGYPVNSLSQHSALMYCRWLYKKTGIFYRLPTEAEWEYACRAGSTTAYFFGNDEQQLKNYAWYKDNSENRFKKVGLKLPNAWGLYDMLGNVCEWTLDHYEENRMENLKDNSSDPFVAPGQGNYPKALRGGGFVNDGKELRCANRFKSDRLWNRRDPQIPKSKWWLTDAPSVGFRIIRPLEQPSTDKIDEFFNKYLGD